MAGTLADLAKNMRALAVSVPVKANVVKQNVVRTINFDLLQSTPVDTGAAVSNWQVQADDAATEAREAFVPSPVGFMKRTDHVGAWTHRNDTEVTRQANIAPALEAAEEVIIALEPGQVVHITNVLPYIQALDEGHSAQAALFVDRAIILGRDTVSRATITS